MSQIHEHYLFESRVLTSEKLETKPIILEHPYPYLILIEILTVVMKTGGYCVLGSGISCVFLEKSGE